LSYFKYSRWLLGGLPQLKTYLPTMVPLGISFFTFEFIHYVSDAYAGRIPAEPEGKPRGRLAAFLHFMAFALFFPTLLAGPIKRYQKFHAEPRLVSADAAYGLSRMLLGLCKKVLIADTAAGFAVRLGVPGEVTPFGLWLAMYAYAVQIYCDFSGYSDLAIGAARLFGYRVPENFDWPYLSTSLSEFWRRWHISLSTWIRDYLFIPLGGSRGSLARTLLNLTAVMAVCGLWHGPGAHFVAWGLWHGLGLGVTQLWRRMVPEPPANKLWYRLLMGLLTLHFVCFGWVLFAAPSLPVAGIAFRKMLGFH
jgi:alginate O-acetyltransferase complex protein AlgI